MSAFVMYDDLIARWAADGSEARDHAREPAATAKQKTKEPQAPGSVVEGFRCQTKSGAIRQRPK